MEHKLNFKAVFGVGNTLAGIGGIVSDVLLPLLPIAKWIITALVMIVGYLILAQMFKRFRWPVTLLVARYNQKPPQVEEDRVLANALTVATSMMVVMIALSYWSGTQAKQGGFTGNIVGVAELRTALTPLLESTQQSEQYLASIDKQVGGLKKETSENPRKELRNMGINWTTQAFFDAVAAGDLDVVRLFLAGGFNPNTLLGFDLPIYAGVLSSTATNQVEMLDLMHSQQALKLDALIQTGVVYAIGMPGRSQLEPLSMSQPEQSIMHGKVTILVLAVYRKNANVIRWLIEHGADPNQKGFIVDFQDQSRRLTEFTAMSEAQKMGDKAVISVLK